MEFAKFYNDNPMKTQADIDQLMQEMEGNLNHKDAFDFAIYFAAWIKAEVGNSKLKFKCYDNEILQKIKTADSLQYLLFEIVEDVIGFTQFRQQFNTDMNGLRKFLERGKINTV